MRVHLRPCARCGRHIRITENRCVFCEAPVDAARQSAPPLGDAASRLRRAATLVAIGTVAGAGVGLEACGGDVRGGTPASAQPGPGTTTPPPGFNGGSSSSGPLVVQGGEAYGVVQFVSEVDAAPDGPTVINVDAAYGVFQFVQELDAAADGDAGPGALDAAGDGYSGPESDVFNAVDAPDGSSGDASGEDGGQIDP